MTKGRLVLIILGVLAYLNMRQIQSAIGCMSNRCGYSTCAYHYVSCQCPCKDITQSGICRRCLHKGDPNRGLFNATELMETANFRYR